MRIEARCVFVNRSVSLLCMIITVIRMLSLFIVTVYKTKQKNMSPPSLHTTTVFGDGDPVPG